MSMMRTLVSLVTATVILAGCSSATDRYLLDDARPATARSTAARLVLVEKMSLPEYFSGGEITFQDKNGVLVTSKQNFWADTPERAFTEMLADALDDRLSADVASAPWPFEVPADLKVEVKVRRFVALNTGMVQFTGQYFLSSPYGGSLAKTARFEIEEPISEEGLQGLTAAYSRALSDLSDLIAKRIAGVGRGEL